MNQEGAALLMAGRKELQANHLKIYLLFVAVPNRK